jgi:hypothetical protein
MRNEFFVDDRDLFKCSYVLELAEPDRLIVYVPTCRPDDRLNKPGIRSIREDVKRFGTENGLAKDFALNLPE